MTEIKLNTGTLPQESHIWKHQF